MFAERKGVWPAAVIMLAACGFAFIALCWAGSPKVYGFVGPGHGGPGSMSEPPFNPSAWHKVEGDVLSIDDVWGRRVKPRGVFEIPGGVGAVLYCHTYDLNNMTLRIAISDVHPDIIP